ncbi:hypothetical protein WR25_18035 [Diploscapter pachys]|uniref:EIPR1-like beta-propeller domain-containing protein n=1 Tax=Diploscapter pachys TaxID=2018661 RepID=A0A2A2JE86_9BILA|nr:hypothetical protein WR25_18035 [Diploscapter pachys]
MGECLMFGLDLESRCLAAVQAEEEKTQFLIGTHNIKMDNMVLICIIYRNFSLCRLTVEGDYSRIASLSFTHPSGEVRAIASCPTNAALVATSSADFRNPNPSFGVFLWNICDDKRSLEELSKVESDRLVHCVQWEPATNRLAAVSRSTVNLFDVASSSIQASGKLPFDQDDLQFHSGTWNPHSSNMLALPEDKHLICWDIRANSESNRVRDAHAHRCMFVDFNPNLQHVVATCGDDGAIRLWDLRKPTDPLISQRPHSHWVWQVRFHPVHDQLLLSAGSDACVVLSCAQSVSSEAVDANEEDEKGEDEQDEEEVATLADGLVDRIDEHEESVYACVWSSADPWAFASLSFDGRLVVSRVSRKHKYALMQL